MSKIERKLEESYKALRVQYRFTERENENFMELLRELRTELKQLRPSNTKASVCPKCGSPLGQSSDGEYCVNVVCNYIKIWT